MTGRDLPGDVIPSDVFEESGCRLPLPRREDLDDAGRESYDRHVDPDGGTIRGLRGPGGIRLHSSVVSQHNLALLHYFRQDADMEGRIRELAILVTARELDSRFEWQAHEPVALREGLAPEIIDVIKYRRAVDALPETERVVILLGRQMFKDRKVAPEIFARALDLFGRPGLVDLLSLMTLYSATASLLVACDMQLPAGEEPLLPVP